MTLDIAISAARAASSLNWLLVMLITAPSAVRSFIGTARPFDKIWGLFAIAAAHQLGYSIRWLSGNAQSSGTAAEIAALVGLHVISSMLALAIIWQRRTVEGSWL